MITKPTGASRGVVSYALGNLGSLGHMERSSQCRWLVGTPKLAECWATGYAETLRPDLTRGRLLFVGNGERKEQETKGGARREVGEKSSSSARACNRAPTGRTVSRPPTFIGELRPERLALYTRETRRSNLLERLGALPDRRPAYFYRPVRQPEPC